MTSHLLLLVPHYFITLFRTELLLNFEATREVAVQTVVCFEGPLMILAQGQRENVSRPRRYSPRHCRQRTVHTMTVQERLLYSSACSSAQISTLNLKKILGTMPPDWLQHQRT